MSEDVTFKIFRGEPDEDGEPFGEMIDYTCLLYTSPSPRDRG